MISSLMVIGAVPASAAGHINDTSASCPASIPDAGFTDIGSLDATTQQAINCIADYGITQGTSATTYGPDGAVLRWQMALFLTRQASVHGVALPSGADQGFTDIGSLDAATQTAINQLAQLGISKGTSTTTFSPLDEVSREQMALFLARLLSAVTTLPASPADAGFTDISGLSAESQLAINQLAEVGVAAGTSATTYAPAADVLRWQMALFLTRVLAEDGIVPAPPAGSLSGTVTAFVAGTSIDIEDADGDVTTVTYGAAETKDTYSIGGTSATLNAFNAALSVGDTIVATKVDTDADYDTWALTNVSVTSGLVGKVNIAADTFAIVTVGNNTLATFNTWTSANTAFTVDGSSATFGQFEAALSHGDTVVVTPDSTGAGGDADTDIDAVALTNGSASGTVAGSAKNVTVDGDGVLNDATFMLNKLGDFFDHGVYASDTMFAVLSGSSASQSYTVDGSAATLASFITALTDGDEVTYARAAGAETFALVNKTVDTSFSGITVQNAINGTVVTYLTGTSVKTFDWSTVTGITITVDGVLVASADVEAQTEGKGLPVADAVSYTMSTKTLAFTNATSTPSLSLDDVNSDNNGSLGAGDYFDVKSGSVLVFDNLPATLGTPNVRYFVNGAQVTQAVYEDYLVEIAADTNTTGDSFQATLDGSFVEHRLTTTEVLP